MDGFSQKGTNCKPGLTLECYSTVLLYSLYLKKWYGQEKNYLDMIFVENVCCIWYHIQAEL